MALNFGFQSSGGSVSVISQLPIQNTLYVAKNGDDATAQPNRLDLPYLTIYAASQAASVGDVIYVFSGTYSEGFNDWVKSNVIYDFQDGAIVQNTWRCISDYGQAKNVRIQGQGTFQVTALNFSFGVVDFQNSDSILYLRCKNVLGITNGFNLYNMTKPYDVKFRYCLTTNQYPLNLRGIANTGRIEFDTIESLTSTVPILFRNCNTDGQRRNVYLKGRRVISRVNAFSQATITFLNVLNTSVYCQIDSIEHISGGSGGIFSADSGYMFMFNTNASGVGYGFLSNGTNTAQIQNCNIYAPTYSLVAQSNASVFAKNTSFLANNPTATGGSAGVAGNGQLTAKNCVFVQKGASVNPCVFNVVSPVLKVSFASCLFIAHPLNTESLRNTNGVAANVYIQEDCAANKPVNALISNQVAGTNIVVDSDVVQNTTNFF